MTCSATGRKRRKAIVARAEELGIPSLGNAARMAGVNKLTREGKSHDNDPEVRHRRWREESSSFVERETLIASVTGHEVDIPREAIRESDGSAGRSCPLIWRGRKPYSGARTWWRRRPMRPPA